MSDAVILFVVFCSLSISLAFSITAYKDVMRQPDFKYGTRLTWQAVVLFCQVIGPFIYYMTARHND